jgi:hypothetical protein
VNEILSPFTRDPWFDIREPIGVLMGIAIRMHAAKPRRRAPKGFDQAMTMALNAVRAYTGVPELSKFGIEGQQVSDAFWLAKEARNAITPFVGEDFNLTGICWPTTWEMAPFEDLREELMASMRYVWPRYVSAARLAWHAVLAIEKAAASSWTIEINDLHPIGSAIRQAELEHVRQGMSLGSSGPIERAWRFCVAAGRLPVPGVDDELLEAFQAAISAGAPDFARRLVRDP